MVSTLPGPEQQARAGWSADLGCPGCGYNLRGLPPAAGLPGVVVDCPECGLRSDVAQLAQRRWDKPWYKAPGFRLMTLPVAWLLLGTVGVLMAAGFLSSAMGLSGTANWLSTLGLVAVLLAGWVLLLVWVFLRNGGMVGVLFSLLVHVAFAAGVSGVILSVGGGIMVIGALIDRPAQQLNTTMLVMGLGLAIAGVVLLVLARVGEKQVAGYCIRRYLRAGTVPTS